MDKKYKPLTPPDKKAYEPFVKPKYVDDTTKPPQTKPFRRKATKPRPLWRVCEKCHNIISDNGECDFCGHTNTIRIITDVVLP